MKKVHQACWGENIHSKEHSIYYWQASVNYYWQLIILAFFFKSEK